MNPFIVENKKFSKFLEGESDIYNDPDYEYALLDDNYSEISCNSTTTSMINDSNHEDFTFTDAMTNFIKAYMDSRSIDDNNLEDNINWLESETDFTSEVGSLADFDNEKEFDIEINHEKTSEYSKQCIVLDIKEGKIQRCLNPRFRSLKQLSGVWELDFQTVDSLFKQNQKNMLETLSLRCEKHSYTAFERNIRLPCMGLKNCPVFNSELLSKKATNNTRCRFICSECFVREGGHFYQRRGRGKNNQPESCIDNHTEDNSKSLELIGKWILSIANTANNNIKNKLLHEITKALINTFKPDSSNLTNIEQDKIEPPSEILLKIALRLQNVNLNKLNNQEQISLMIEKQPEQFGKALGHLIWKSKQSIKENIHSLENPSSLQEYKHSFPSTIKQFFNSMLDYIQYRKWIIVHKKQQQRGIVATEYNSTRGEKISLFLISVLLTVTFPSVNIWLTHILSSLCQKPHYRSSLYAVLCTANVVSHTSRHERRLEKIRQKDIDPCQKLWRGENILNICIMDNVDLKEKTFTYDNIFDATRKTMHCIIRIIIQFKFPKPLLEIISENIFDIDEDTNFRVGTSLYTERELLRCTNIFSTLINENSSNFDIQDIIQEYESGIQSNCHLPIPNIVILRPGDNPNKTEDVHNAAHMYKDDVGISFNGKIYLATDEALYSRLVSLKETHPEFCFLLGGWHTSKNMCITLISIFSGYGIFNLASILGVRYFDKFEKVVDYQAASRVVMLLWAGVGIALQKYIKNCNKTIHDIMSGNNNIVKVWYLFFCWAGYWVGHKMGIRHGNWNMQIQNLKAFAPLFPVAGHNNYARSVTFFLNYLHQDRSLSVLLSKVPSVNITRPGHYFAFDEALERFGVMYVKQNIGKVLKTDDELKLQITSVQSERERLTILLDEYVGEKLFTTSDHILQSRKPALWKLSKSLLDAFLASDPTKHELFQNTSQNYEDGFNKLFTCYEIGQNRIYNIYRQDIEKSEIRTTIGRRAHNVVICPINKQKENKKIKKKLINPQDNKIYKNNSDLDYPEMQEYVTECPIQ